MKPVISLWFCAWLFSFCTSLANEPVLEASARLELEGHFREAAVLLQHELQKPELRSPYRQQLEFELVRLDRIRQDYPYTKEALFSALKKTVQSLTKSEYEQWIHEGRFDVRLIDNQLLFMASSVANLFFRYPELNPCRLPLKNPAELEKHHWETCVAIKRAALAQHRPYVLPKRFITTMTISAQPNAAPDGKIIRAWLPVPRAYPFQYGFHLISSQPEPRHVSDDQSTARSVYLEQPAHKGKPTLFKIEYEYETQGVWHDVDPAKVSGSHTNDPNLKPFTAEAPHVVFTPEIRKLSEEIAGTETNPYLKAKRFYEWISEHIKYSFAVEYSTVRNLGDYCRRNGYGDCGEEALLFITLCRLNGIPARWQSGWNTFPGAKSIHDWCEIYLAPYGWIPVDPYMGIYAMQYATTLELEQRREIRDFYFGGLDQYRMGANSDHNQTLTPPKNSVRSDNVDFQRGELEWGDHNLYFDSFSCELTSKEVPLEP